jgi:hypothetical protein
MFVDEWFKQYHHDMCGVEEILMARTQPKMKMSVENVLRYISPQN